MKQKVIRVEMGDGSKWDVPAEIVANDRAAHFTTYQSGIEKGNSFKQEKEFALQDNEALLDWAENNINWKDIGPHAKRVKTGTIDYQEGWVNGHKEVIEE